MAKTRAASVSEQDAAKLLILVTEINRQLEEKEALAKLRREKPNELAQQSNHTSSLCSHSIVTWQVGKQMAKNAGRSA